MTEYLAALKRERAQNGDKAKAHRPTVHKALRELGELGRNARRRIGIAEAPLSEAEILKAEEIFGDTLHVSAPRELLALPPPAPAKSPNGFEAEFGVGELPPEDAGGSKPARAARPRAATDAEPPNAAPATPTSEPPASNDPPPQLDYSFDEEDE